MNELTLEEMEVFLAFARARNALSAAGRLDLSQPAFNERLRRLELKLKPSPFAWEGNKRVLSDFGARLAEQLEPQLMALHRSVSTAFAAESGFQHRPLRVAGRSEIFARLTLAQTWFPHPLSLSVCSSRDALLQVEQGKCDVAISISKPTNPELVLRRLFFSTAVFAVSRSHLPKAWRGRGWPDESKGREFLRNVPWLAYGSSDALHLDFLKRMGLADVEVDRRVVCDDWQVLWRLVRAGVGCAVLPAAYVEPQVHEVFLFSPSPEFQRNPFYLVTRKELVNLGMVRQFFEFAHQALNRVESSQIR